jgi:hypothetical protein
VTASASHRRASPPHIAPSSAAPPFPQKACLENQPLKLARRTCTPPIPPDITLVDASHALEPFDVTLINPTATKLTPPLLSPSTSPRRAPSRSKKSLVRFLEPASKIAAPRLSSRRPEFLIVDSVRESQRQQRRDPGLLYIRRDKHRKPPAPKPEKPRRPKRTRNTQSVSFHMRVISLSLHCSIRSSLNVASAQAQAPEPKILTKAQVRDILQWQRNVPQMLDN